MINLVNYISESNIDRTERKYREFAQLCKGHDVEPNDVCVKKTSKNNWAVYKDGKRLFTASNYILDDDVVDRFSIKLCED